MSQNVFQILSKKQIAQRTDEWYRARYNCLTASNVASALEANPYFTKLDLLIQKCNDFELNTADKNPAVRWGVKYEPIAIDIYQKLREEIVYHVGLFIHPQYPWLGASPDGLRDSGKLVEIKCVYSRNVTDSIPLYYWMQVQIQLEVCDLEECDLFQCKFVECKSNRAYRADKQVLHKGFHKRSKRYWKLERYSLNVIKRDRDWFRDNVTKLDRFWKDVLHYRRVGYQQLLIDSGVLTIPQVPASEVGPTKRKSADSIGIKKLKTRSQINWEYIREDRSNWIRASDTKNFMLNDPLVDWLIHYNSQQDKKKQYVIDKNNEFNEYINKKDSEFRIDVFDYLKKFGGTAHIGDVMEGLSIGKAHETKEAMIRGVPIIIQGILHNKDNCTFAVPDIIIRDDYISQVFTLPPEYLERITSNREQSAINFRYSIINVRAMSMDLKGTGNIMNVGMISAYKSELIICSEALYKILGYVPGYCYLLSKKWKEGKTRYSPFERIGIVDVSGRDMKILDKTYQALEWLQELRVVGSTWSIGGSRPELYPNMCNLFDYPWHGAKKIIAHHLGEVTQLWNCGIRERKLAHTKGVYHCGQVTSDIVEFKGVRREILDNILIANLRGVNIMNHHGLDPTTVQKEFYVDFETVNESENGEGMIYMIGVGHMHQGQWIFVNFVADRLTFECEARIVGQWLEHMLLLHGGEQCRIYHWSNAEVSLTKKAFERNNIAHPDWLVWFDLLKYFKDNRIAIAGAYNYSLKTVASSLYKQRLIKTKWDESNCADGTAAMMAAIKYGYDEDILGDREEMAEVVRYNEVDCKVMWEIVELLRSF